MTRYGVLYAVLFQRSFVSILLQCNFYFCTFESAVKEVSKKREINKRVPTSSIGRLFRSDCDTYCSDKKYVLILKFTNWHFNLKLYQSIDRT